MNRVLDIITEYLVIRLNELERMRASADQDVSIRIDELLRLVNLTNALAARLRDGDRVCLDKDRRDLYICSHRELLAENGIVFNSLGSSVDRNGRDHVAFICRDDHGDHCILFHGNGHIAGVRHWYQSGRWKPVL